MNDDLIRIQDLKKYFPIRGVLGRTIGYVKAVDRLSFSIRKGETFGLVGESGCGKTTTGKLILNLLSPTAGRIDFEGQDIATLSPNRMRSLRRDMQIIFQDPFSSLSPRMKVSQIIAEGLGIHRIGNKEGKTRVTKDLMEVVGLEPGFANRYPHEFSGGQRQRIGIARALALNPKLIVCDEPVSALDVSIQSQIINLLKDLQEQFGLTYLFISHDLRIVKHISDRVGVMYLGKLVELAPGGALYSFPKHPYTQALLSAIPSKDLKKRKERIILRGDIPSPSNPPDGCRFHTRCLYTEDVCRRTEPEFIKLDGDHYVACHRA